MTGRKRIVWVYDLNKSSAIRRLTLGGKERYPIWSADGQWVAFQSTREGDAGIFRQRADGSGAVERLTTADPGAIPHSRVLVADGECLPLQHNEERHDDALAALPGLEERATPFGDVRSVGNQVGASFSPDGKWVAYSTGERSATNENFVFVQPFPATGARYQISQAGENGHHPHVVAGTRRNCIYVPLVGQFVVRSITTGPSFSFGNPMPVPADDSRSLLR